MTALEDAEIRAVKLALRDYIAKRDGIGVTRQGLYYAAVRALRKFEGQD